MATGLAATKVPHENVYLHPQNKPTKNAKNHGNFTKRTSELHERAINSKKRSQCHLLFRGMYERL